MACLTDVEIGLGSPSPPPPRSPPRHARDHRSSSAIQLYLTRMEYDERIYVACFVTVWLTFFALGISSLNFPDNLGLLEAVFGSFVIGLIITGKLRSMKGGQFNYILELPLLQGLRFILLTLVVSVCTTFIFHHIVVWKRT
jgi:hypothetical protein